MCVCVWGGGVCEYSVCVQCVCARLCVWGVGVGGRGGGGCACVQVLKDQDFKCVVIRHEVTLCR